MCSRFRYAVIAAGCASCPKLKCERPGCETSFCYHCKQQWHPNQTCDAARKRRSLHSRLRPSFSQTSDSAPNRKFALTHCALSPSCLALNQLNTHVVSSLLIFFATEMRSARVVKLSFLFLVVCGLEFGTQAVYCKSCDQVSLQVKQTHTQNKRTESSH